MARNENPPFQRGTTFYNELGTTPTLVDALQWLGKTWLFEDINLNSPYGVSGSAKPARTNRYVKCMVVRNASGGTLAPSLMAKMDVSTPASLTQVSGLATAAGDIGYPIDEYLPGPVQANDLFWVVVEGPALVTTGASGATNIATGNFLTYTTGGKLVVIDNTQTGANLYSQILSCPGQAIDTVNAINTLFLMNVLSRGIA